MKSDPDFSKFNDYGFVCQRQKPWAMSGDHRHHDVELNFIYKGWVEYLFGGARRRLTGGQLAIFWASVPHKITAFSKDNEYQVVHLALDIFLHWNIPGPLPGRLLAGEVVVAKSKNPAWDEALFFRWNQDKLTDGVNVRETLFLELQAYLRRLSNDKALAPVHSSPVKRNDQITQVDVMARFVAENFAEPISVEDIAREAGLQADAATRAFKNQFGMTLVDFLTRHRVACSQRLLVTTDLKVMVIALESGFGSESRFYKVFQEQCGISPRQYRKNLSQK
jgi:AraC-like DNA-binding protein